jgi:hypothetical protein
VIFKVLVVIAILSQIVYILYYFLSTVIIIEHGNVGGKIRLSHEFVSWMYLSKHLVEEVTFHIVLVMCVLLELYMLSDHDSHSSDNCSVSWKNNTRQTSIIFMCHLSYTFPSLVFIQFHFRFLLIKNSNILLCELYSVCLSYLLESPGTNHKDT